MLGLKGNVSVFQCLAKMNLSSNEIYSVSSYSLQNFSILHVVSKNENMFVIAFVEKLERDENNEKIRIRKKKVTMTIEEIHREMIKQDGGFPEARDENGEVFITPSAIRKYWPNQIGPMKERDKLMCSCAECII